MNGETGDPRDPLGAADTGSSEGSPEARNTTRRTVLVDGELYEIGRGQNRLPDGRNVWWNKDGSTSISTPTNALVVGNRAGNHESPGQPTPGERHMFTGGNQLAVTHGAHSVARVAPVAEEILRVTREAVPWAGKPEFAQAFGSWATLVARAQLVSAYLEENGPLDEHGDVRPAAELEIRLLRAASDATTKLGLEPSSFVRLQRELAETGLATHRLGDALRDGQAILDRRQGAPGPPQDAQDAIWGDRASPEGDSKAAGAGGPQGGPGARP